MPPVSRTQTRRRPRVQWVKHAPAPAVAPSLATWSWGRADWAIVLVAVAALALRLHGLAQRYVIFDESVILDPDALRLGLIPFAQKLWHETTYNPGWPMLIWVVQRITGLSTFWGRVPSAVCGSLAPIAFWALARELGLSRRSAVLAGSVLGCAVFQVEYGQQLMPHAALPLGCCLALWIVSRLSSLDRPTGSWQYFAWMGALITVFGVMMVLHNSTLLLIPPLLGYLGWSARDRTAGSAEGGDPLRRTALCAWLVCALALGFTALGWFIAKVGHSDWHHLRPFFMTTFRDAEDRTIVSDLLRFLDSYCLPALPPSGGTASALRAGGYFTATRLIDLLYGQFRLRGEQQFTGRLWAWLLPVAMMVLSARGAFRALRGWTQAPVTRWVVVAGGTLSLIVVLSAFRIFPLGGIRHLIVLSPFLILTVAIGLESKSRVLSHALAGLCLAWMIGDLHSLPHYYRMTHDHFGPKRMQELAKWFDVHDFVAADTLCSEGALRLVAEQRPDGRMIPADHPAFARLTTEHKPFFLCALHDPILSTSKQSTSPTASPRFRELAHPLANLRHYRPVLISAPSTAFYWLTWTVYYMEPKRDIPSPEVIDITQCQEPDSNVPWAFVVRFNRPIRRETLNRDSIQLVASSRPDPPLIPIDFHYAAATRTLTITPLDPLAPEPHVLALFRTICDMDGHPLDANGTAFYHHFPSGPSAGNPRVDRGWLIRAETTPRSSKL